MVQPKLTPQKRRNLCIRLTRKCTPKRCLFVIIIVTLVIEVIVNIELSRRYYIDDESGKWRIETELKITNPINKQKMYHTTFTIDWASEVEAVGEVDQKEGYLEYGGANSTHPCSLTVLILDPRLPILSRDKALWGSIESTIAHGPEDMCVLIQTSPCITDTLNATTNYNNKSKIAYEEIYQRAPYPLFRDFLSSGRVRITFLNHSKYHVRSCSNFITPTHIWVNYHYWEDEFLQGVDSDMVMIIQDDTVLCHDIDITKWNDVAYVGAPWPNVHKSVRKPSQCEYLSILWNQWNTPPGQAENITNRTNICQLDQGIGPYGNGGLSLRSRKWMKQAILTCPHFKYSGLSSEYIQSSKCAIRTIKFVPEDVYYATILRGINAPLPTSFEASLFSSEIYFPEEIITKEWYTPKYLSLLLPLVQSRYSTSDVNRFKDFYTEYTTNIIQNKKYKPSLHHFIPIGVHNIWFYHNKTFLLNLADPIENWCSHFRHVLPMQSLPDSMRMKAYKFGIGFHD